MRSTLLVLLFSCQVVLAQSTQQAPTSQPAKRIISRINRGPGTQPVIVSWCTGVVRDEAGQPVPNATVYAYAVFHGGMRMYEDVQKATTDPDGRYDIRGEGYRQAFSATMIAVVPGRPPALAWLRLPEPGYAQMEEGTEPPPAPPWVAPTLDFVIPSADAKADVTVLRDGKPSAGVAVQLRLEGVNLRDMWAAGGDENAPEVRKLFYPTRQTGPDGVARFDVLLPGRYTVHSKDAPDMAVEMFQSPRFDDDEQKAVGEARGVAMRLGETTKFTLAIAPQPNLVRMRLLPVDGHPVTDDRVPIQWGPWSGGGWSSGQKLVDGVLDKHLENQGLAMIRLQYQDAPSKTVPLSPPFYEAAAIFAVSSRLTYEQPIDVKARPVHGGTIEVTLLDRDGKPAGGNVELLDPADTVQQTKTAGDDGRVRFEGVSPGYPYTLRMAGARLPKLEYRAKALPPDGSLVRVLAALNDPAVTTPGRTTRVTLQPKHIGYVRGRVIVPPGAKVQDYSPGVDRAVWNRGTRVGWNADTGEFVIGPLPAGPALVRLYREPYGARQLVDSVEVKVEFSKVATIEMKPAPTVAATQPAGGVMLGVGGISTTIGGMRTLGRVTLADGKTPAVGAMVFVFNPGELAPLVCGYADAAGAIREKNLSYFDNGSAGDDGATEDARVAVALLPGTAGATIHKLPLGDLPPLMFALPVARSVRGAVTIGGKPATGQAGSIRVLACHQGQGKLDGLLSINVSANEDGSFELAGLSDGKYLVQAALDDVWLSGSISFETTGDLKPITLDIGEPGPPLEAQLTPEQMAADVELMIDRPAGPLAEMLWPKSLLPDGAGVVHVPAVEAGERRLRVGGREISVTVPALSNSKAPVKASFAGQ